MLFVIYTGLLWFEHNAHRLSTTQFTLVAAAFSAMACVDTNEESEKE